MRDVLSDDSYDDEDVLVNNSLFWFYNFLYSQSNLHRILHVSILCVYLLVCVHVCLDTRCAF